VIAIAIAFAAARSRMRRADRDSIGLFAIVMVALVMVTGPLASWIFDPRGLSHGLSLILVNAIWLPTLTVLLGIAISAVRSSEQVLTILQQQVGDAEVAAWAAQEESTRIRKQLATTLHGSVQSRLLAAAVLMRQPSLVFDSGIEDPAIYLSGLMHELDAMAVADLRPLIERLAEVTKPWEALMTVDTVLGVVVDASLHDRIVHVVEEGLSNAYRHGGAMSVACTVMAEEGCVVVTISDDGSFSGVSGSPGMGSALLDSIAPGRWTLQRSERGGGALRVIL